MCYCTSILLNKVLSMDEKVSSIDRKLSGIEEDIRSFSKKLDEREERMQSCIDMLKGTNK